MTLETEQEAEAPASANEKASPMVAQYLAIKEKHPLELLFFRMGDFYEMFFDDAVAASRALDIALTKRGQYKGKDIPMCGVPVHSHTGYVARLIKNGFRVAVCEQTETPAEAKKRTGKTLVNRDVVRIITPGTLTEDTLLEARSNNYLLAVVGAAQGDVALAWCDLSTGSLEIESTAQISLLTTLSRLLPREVLLSEELAKALPHLSAAIKELGAAITLRPQSLFNPQNCHEKLLGFYDVASLDSWGDFSAIEITAAGALLDYVQLTQVGAVPRMDRPRKNTKGGLLEIDAASRRNLEITQTITGDKNGSLLSVIDQTVTASGSRLMLRRLSSPLTDVEIIKNRQQAILWAMNQTQHHSRMRECLSGAPDLERALSRLSLDRAGPRDLLAVRATLTAASNFFELLNSAELPVTLHSHAQNLIGQDPLSDLLKRALKEDVPLLAREGNFVAEGYSQPLDHYNMLKMDGKRLIAALQLRYVNELGLSTLKIKYNNIIGYHVEVSAQQAEKIINGPRATEFIHRQTMAGAMRFTTKELVQLERDMGEAVERSLSIELEIFEILSGSVLNAYGALSAMAAALAEFDVALSLADLAERENWCCPEIDESTDFDIEEGRHPVVEKALKNTASVPFIANDCHLATSQRLWLLSGPNMAGKSTFLRQNALMVVLAQMGSFVPAKHAKIGIVDRLFSRVGASDDLARGRSTFMVEMVETATILNLATPKSLVILDEIGRGTATHDGLAIAWATAEHLHNVNRCRALFATHYHELSALTATLSALACHSMRVKEWKGEIVFLHEVIAGSADRSYGIHVAQLAGLPPVVIKRAQNILNQLQAEKNQPDELPLFSLASDDPAMSTEKTPAYLSEESGALKDLEKTLLACNPETLSPRDALDFVYQLKEKLLKIDC